VASNHNNNKKPTSSGSGSDSSRLTKGKWVELESAVELWRCICNARHLGVPASGRRWLHEVTLKEKHYISLQPYVAEKGGA
jgi:hypothetical protein